MDTPWTDLDRPPLREAALRAALTDGDGGARAWRALELVASTGSTNADVAARARAGEPEGLVLVADHQDAGRGRLDRGWVAPPRSSLSVSVLLRPGAAGVPPQRLSWLPLLAGLAVVDALTRRCGLAARLKWPNDVLVPAGGVPAGEGPELRKICGILAELVPAADGSAAVVLGAGINVSQSADELPVPTATSLRLAGSAITDRDPVLRAYLRALASRYRAWVAADGDPRASGVGAAYREACVTLGLQVAVELPGQPPVRGQAQAVDGDGRLVVACSDGLRALAAGDVVHVNSLSS